MSINDHQLSIFRKRNFSIIFGRANTKRNVTDRVPTELQLASISVQPVGTARTEHTSLLFLYAFHRSTMYIVGLSVKHGLYFLE